MPRTSRILVSDEKAVYHVMSHTALDGFPLGDVEKEFMRKIKVGFARYYNRRHNRRGYIWGDRFKNLIAGKGETLVNCLAYIDLNPVKSYS